MKAERVRGSVETLNGETVVEDHHVRLMSWTERGGEGLHNWGESLDVDPGVFLDPGEHYILSLRDGRQGEMGVSNVTRETDQAGWSSRLRVTSSRNRQSRSRQDVTWAP